MNARYICFLCLFALMFSTAPGSVYADNSPINSRQIPLSIRLFTGVLTHAERLNTEGGNQPASLPAMLLDPAGHVVLAGSPPQIFPSGVTFSFISGSTVNIQPGHQTTLHIPDLFTPAVNSIDVTTALPGAQLTVNENRTDATGLLLMLSPDKGEARLNATLTAPMPASAPHASRVRYTRKFPLTTGSTRTIAIQTREDEQGNASVLFITLTP